MFSLICRRQTLLFPHKPKVRKARDIPYEWNWAPPRTGKPGKMRRHFPVREKSGNFEQTGKVRENDSKYWKTQGISDNCYLLFLSDI